MLSPFHRFALLAAFAVALMVPGLAHADTPGADYAMGDTLPLPGATRWDYLAFDAKTHRLFITRGDSVDVLDVESGKIAGSIPNTSGVHGVALAPEFGKGFVSNGDANTITVFDLTTLKTLATVPAGTKPDAIVYDPASKRVFAANGKSADMTVLDAKDAKPAGTIKLGGKPEFAVVDGEGKLYVNLEDKSELVVIDTKTLKLANNYDLGPRCDGPTGLAIDAAHKRLFSVCGSKVMVVVDAETGHITDTLPIGKSSDAAVFDPGTGLAFSSNGDGTLTVAGPSSSNHYKVIQTVTTMPTARTMALDPVTHRLYLAAAEADGDEPPTTAHPGTRPHIKPDTFMILTVEPKPASTDQ